MHSDYLQHIQDRSLVAGCTLTISKTPDGSLVAGSTVTISNTLQIDHSWRDAQWLSQAHHRWIICGM